jgi:hypothetical protein
MWYVSVLIEERKECRVKKLLAIILIVTIIGGGAVAFQVLTAERATACRVYPC